jgi:hypothetical protein
MEGQSYAEINRILSAESLVKSVSAVTNNGTSCRAYARCQGVAASHLVTNRATYHATNQAGRRSLIISVIAHRWRSVIAGGYWNIFNHRGRRYIHYVSSIVGVMFTVMMPMVMSMAMSVPIVISPCSG